MRESPRDTIAAISTAAGSGAIAIVRMSGEGALEIADAIFDGHRLAREFECDNPQFALPYIRERQVWGHETFPKLDG